MNYSDLNGQKLEVCKASTGKIKIIRCHKVSKMLKITLLFTNNKLAVQKQKKRPYLLNYTVDDVLMDIYQQYHLPGFSFRVHEMKTNNYYKI